MMAITSPSEILPPSTARTSFTTPAASAGTSMVALSVSSVIRLSSMATVWPGWMKTSMTSTLLCPPISGTFSSIRLLMALSTS
ncbi:hypothetical protein D3C85_1394560 [compost metagenome]